LEILRKIVKELEMCINNLTCEEVMNHMRLMGANYQGDQSSRMLLQGKSSLDSSEQKYSA
jgi:hypothetical protein